MTEETTANDVPITQPAPENAGPPFTVKQVTIIYLDTAGHQHCAHLDREKDQHTFVYTWFDLWINGSHEKNRNP